MKYLRRKNHGDKSSVTDKHTSVVTGAPKRIKMNRSKRKTFVVALVTILLISASGLSAYHLTRKEKNSNEQAQTEANSNERQIRLNKERADAAGSNEEKLAALLGLAADYMLLEDEEGSINTYKQVLELDPNNEAALGSLANIYYERKDKPNAELYLTRVIDVIGEASDPRVANTLTMYETMLTNTRNGSFEPYDSGEVA